MTGQARLKRGLVVAGIVLVLDQAVKYAMLQYLIYGFRPSVEVLPFFNLVVVWNYGISFGMFNTGSASAAYLFAGLALAIVAGLLWWLRNAENGTVVLALGLVVGGAVAQWADDGAPLFAVTHNATVVGPLTRADVAALGVVYGVSGFGTIVEAGVPSAGGRGQIKLCCCFQR